MEKINVLFVCMGNICRSPTGQGVFESLVKNAYLDHLITTDSAGTHAYHIGEPPDSRSVEAARRHDVDLTKQRARRVAERDFEHFDYILAMDNNNMEDLRVRCPEEYQDKIFRVLDFAEGIETREVPDPYYGGARGFETVFDLIKDGASGLLNNIRSQLEL